VFHPLSVKEYQSCFAHHMFHKRHPYQVESTRYPYTTNRRHMPSSSSCQTLLRNPVLPACLRTCPSHWTTRVHIQLETHRRKIARCKLSSSQPPRSLKLCFYKKETGLLSREWETRLLEPRARGLTWSCLSSKYSTILNG